MNYEKIRNKVRVHMNILVIGNGFDLAHGLPTSYKEFLKFVLESEDMCSRFQKNGLGAKESASAVAEIKEIPSYESRICTGLCSNAEDSGC